MLQKLQDENKELRKEMKELRDLINLISEHIPVNVRRDPTYSEAVQANLKTAQELGPANGSINRQKP
jgi:hypothetical protein